MELVGNAWVLIGAGFLAWCAIGIADSWLSGASVRDWAEHDQERP